MACRCFCTPAAAEVVPPTGPPVCADTAPANSPLCPLALGFSGDNIPLLTGNGGLRFGTTERSPVTFLRIGGRVEDAGRPAFSPEERSPCFSVSEKSENGVVSAPRAIRRAFSCLAWIDRKCVSNSCHLISSRPILDRVDSAPIDLKVRIVNKQPLDYKGKGNSRLGGNVKKPCRVNCIQPIPERNKSGALGQEH
jgi:hypothetical protein